MASFMTLVFDTPPRTTLFYVRDDLSFLLSHVVFLMGFFWIIVPLSGHCLEKGNGQRQRERGEEGGDIQSAGQSKTASYLISCNLLTHGHLMTTLPYPLPRNTFTILNQIS